MGLDFEFFLGADGDDIADAYDDAICDAIMYDEKRKHSKMAEEPKEFIVPEGETRMINWKGQEVAIKAEYSDHVFTDEEIEMLSKGQVIDFELTNKYAGMHIYGKLFEMISGAKYKLVFSYIFQEKGDYYYGLAYFVKSGKFNIPKEVKGHKLTSDEVDANVNIKM